MSNRKDLDCLVLKVGDVRSFQVEADAERSEQWEKRGIKPEAWRCCFKHWDGTIFLPTGQKSIDGGRTIVRHGITALGEISILHNMRHAETPGPEGAVFSSPDLFLALDGWVSFRAPGEYVVKSWRSVDNLQTLDREEAVLHVPGGPERQREAGEWFGLYITRNILRMPDGSLLATAYGHFEEDRIVPPTLAGRTETLYMTRTFVIRSTDDGRTWDYLSTVAAPTEGDPVDEGFGEPTLALLDDGGLLCVMRTGHQRPLYACRSEDQGRTWTDPVYTGLERGCFPCLTKLEDGRLVLTFGVRFPPGWSRITPEGDHGRWRYPGAGLVKLAVSADGIGQDWVETTIGEGMGTCYSTSFETEPNIVFCHVDGWYWRVMLTPRVPDAL